MTAWSRISHAAATGSAKTAISVGISSGTTCRLSPVTSGIRERLRRVQLFQVPSVWDSAGRDRVCTIRILPHARLISPTTLLPDKIGDCPTPQPRRRTRVQVFRRNRNNREAIPGRCCKCRHTEAGSASSLRAGAVWAGG